MNRYYWIEVVIENECVYAVGGLNFNKMLEHVSQLTNDFPYTDNFKVCVHVMTTR